MGRFGGTVAVQALLAPVSLWALDDHLQAILLVLVAAQLAALRERRLAVAALVLANGAFFVRLVRSQPGIKAIQWVWRMWPTSPGASCCEPTGSSARPARWSPKVHALGSG